MQDQNVEMLNVVAQSLINVSRERLSEAAVEDLSNPSYVIQMSTSMVLAGIAAAVLEARNLLRDGYSTYGGTTMESKIENVLAVIQDLVDDESLNWRVKREKILRAVRDHDERETALKEFVSWFEPEQ